MVNFNRKKDESDYKIRGANKYHKSRYINHLTYITACCCWYLHISFNFSLVTCVLGSQLASVWLGGRGGGLMKSDMVNSRLEMNIENLQFIVCVYIINTRGYFLVISPFKVSYGFSVLAQKGI